MILWIAEWFNLICTCIIVLAILLMIFSTWAGVIIGVLILVACIWTYLEQKLKTTVNEKETLP